MNARTNSSLRHQQRWFGGEFAAQRANERDDAGDVDCGKFDHQQRQPESRNVERPPHRIRIGKVEHREWREGNRAADTASRGVEELIVQEGIRKNHGNQRRRQWQ